MLLALKFGLQEGHRYLTEKNMSRFASLDTDHVINVAILNSIPQQEPSDAGLKGELVYLQTIANRFGLYDAADTIRWTLLPLLTGVRS